VTKLCAMTKLGDLTIPILTLFPHLIWVCFIHYWILRIRMFLSLLDLDLLLFDQIRIWIYIRIRILPSTSKKSKKNLDFYQYLTSYLLFYFEN
jgi:hypothetical protein